MQVIIKVKGEDDFGKESINHRISKYSHHYPVMKKKDILIYYYPQGDNSSTTGRLMIGAYQVINDDEHYYKDGFSYEAGTMKRLTGAEISGGFTEWHFSIQETHPKLWRAVEDLVIRTLKKYNPEYLK